MGEAESQNHRILSINTALTDGFENFIRGYPSGGVKSMRENSVKKALREGKVVIGGNVSQLKGVVIPQIYATAGLQFIYIDMQHSAYTIGDVLDLTVGARAAGIDSIVRIPSIDPPFITRLLDSGVQGLMIPNLRTPKEVVQVVNSIKYPPQGGRSIALPRVHTDFQKPNAEEMTQRANEQTLVIIQIENETALNHLEEISQIQGVDALFIGPYDLSESLGHLGQISHPKVLNAIEKIIEVCVQSGIAPGMTLPFDLRNADRWLRKGLRLISYSNDIDLIVEGVSRGVKKIINLIENQRCIQ
jgi:2-keto-3-deoxy-L-rhamnonate aldolase RhmA